MSWARVDWTKKTNFFHQRFYLLLDVVKISCLSEKKINTKTVFVGDEQTPARLFTSSTQVAALKLKRFFFQTCLLKSCANYDFIFLFKSFFFTKIWDMSPLGSAVSTRLMRPPKNFSDVQRSSLFQNHSCCRTFEPTRARAHNCLSFSLSCSLSLFLSFTVKSEVIVHAKSTQIRNIF